MSLPLVSIAIITYNQKEFLRECIESCLAQDYENIEIIVADDCSTDGTQEMLMNYKQKYTDKFFVCLSDRNLGITENSNLALNRCKGKYIAWMGGDDLMFPSKISTQVDYMESNPSCVICYHNLDVFDSYTGRTLYYFNNKLKINGDVHTLIQKGCFNGACSTMVRATSSRNTIFNSAVPVASDWLYWIEVLVGGGTIDYIDEVLGRYRRHSNNVTDRSSLGQNYLDHLNSCNIIFTKYPSFFSDTMKAYSRCLIDFRHYGSYHNVLIYSLRLSFNIKSVLGLIIYFSTLGRVKL